MSDRPPSSKSPGEARPIMFGANSSWNLTNFRLPLITAMQERGHRILAAVPGDVNAPELKRLGIEVHEVPIDARAMSPLRDLQLLFQFRKLMRETAPSMYFGFTAKPNIYGSLAASSLNIPVVATITGLGTSFLSDPALRITVSLLYRVALRNSARVFFHNAEDRDLFVNRRIVKQSVAAVVSGSGVDVSRFSPTVPTEPAGPFTFLFVGRLLRDKGVLEFLEAAAMVRRQSRARFQLLGELDDHPRAVPAATIQPFVGNGTVELLGGTADVRPFISNAHCVVLPSYREGLPRAILEASAMAKPVIATDVPGCRQAVAHLGTGFLCRPRSATALASAMSAVIAMTAEERQAMGRRGRAKVELEFSEDRVVAAYLRELAEIGL